MEEKFKFPSEEWLERYVEELNNSKEYAEAAKDWEGDFLYVITPDKGFDKEYVYYLDLYHGKVRDHYKVESRTAKQAEFMYIGKYGNWMKMVEGKLDGMKAILTGKMKLKGNMTKAMKYTRAAAELTKAATRVPTED
ncbi:MAG TPA: SCP2 sterol-binding domain-containing protein [Methanomassiliicoccales archaeon]|nr:SCP2 sterol-binding domain-containing protein [Methanomassiliicoccales archaeon]